MDESHANPSPVPEGDLVLYDGTCAACTGGVKAMGKLLARRGIAHAPLQAPEAALRLGAPAAANSALEFTVALASGEVLRGPSAHRYLLRRVIWARPLYWFSVLPGGRWLFDAGYRAFSKHRHRISRACQLDTTAKD